MACREIGFDPIAQPDKCAASSSLRDRYSGAQGNRPVVSKRLFPDQGEVFVRRTRDLDLIEWRARFKNASEYFLDLGFASAGVEQMNTAISVEQMLVYRFAPNIRGVAAITAIG